MNIIVTGASHGVGYAAALEFGKTGANVFATGRTSTMLNALTEKWKEFGNTGKLIIHSGDISTEEGVNAVIQTYNESFETIDVLVNNAGLQIGNALLENVDVKQYNYMHFVHAIAPLLFYKAFFPKMKSRATGFIINVVSVTATKSYAKETYGAYSTSKYAQLGFGTFMAKEAAKYNVRVSNVLLGGANTNLRNEPRPEYLSPESIAKALVMLTQLPNEVYIPELQISPKIQV